MGVMAVQVKQPAAGLPYFVAALDADPSRGQYWLNYIDALFQAGQLATAREVLALAQRQGLQGEEVDALAARVEDGAQVADEPDVECADNLGISPPGAAAVSKDNQKQSGAERATRDKSRGNAGSNKGLNPSPQEVDSLVSLFSQERFREAEDAARTMTMRFPRHEFGWKALGAVFKQTGRSADALVPMQQAVALSPDDVEAQYNLGVTLQDLGRLEEAESSYRQALLINPNYTEACSNLGVVLQKLGRLDEAEIYYRRALRIRPDYAEAHSNLGVILHKMGRPGDAEISYRRAIQINRDHAETHNNLGNALKDLDRLDEATASYRQALRINPDYAEAHYNLGIVLADMCRPDEAETSFRRALKIVPEYADAHYNLGNLLKESGRPNEAQASYRMALEIKPDFEDAHSNLGVILSESGLLDEAEACFRKALQITPDSVGAHYNLGVILKKSGRLDEAEACYRRTLRIAPKYIGAHYNLGNLLRESGRLDEAQASYRAALQINPDFVEARSNLGLILKDLGRLDEAEACYLRVLNIRPDDAAAHCMLGAIYHDWGRSIDAAASCRRALEIDPDYTQARINLGGALQHMNRLDEAVTTFRRALESDPNCDLAHNNLLFCLLQDARMDAEALFSEHLRFAEQFEAPLRAGWPRHGNSRDPDRPLQVGFVSGDLRDHAVAYFIEPVLAHLAGYAQLSLHAYSNTYIDDHITQRLRGHFAHWHPISSLSDAALAEKILADDIDILIDLSGHTAKNRLLTFARKPAPVQVSWMGYPGTTGLSAMDYYLADRFFVPHEGFSAQFSEKIVLLPASAPFIPNKDAPPVNSLPALNNGYVTFGSFNRPSKINRPVVALWAQLLRSLPKSRMLLAGMPAKENDTLSEWFELEGIERSRLSFHMRSDMGRYLDLHHQVDICLDTFPYNGGTTTLHALWMGVPTLTLTGSTAAGRSGVTILSHAGLAAFIAHDAEDFLRKGLSMAGNHSKLEGIRSHLRERMTQSAMGQPAIIAAGLYQALCIMWQRWCSGLPAESFEVAEHETTDSPLATGD
jgi:tetratricopeptide (TPR) repeat protein